MKKLVYMYAFLFCATLFAQEEKVPPTNADYKDALSYYEEWSKNAQNPDFYKDLEMNVKGTTDPNKKPKEKPVKIKDLPVLQQDVFYLYQAEQCSNSLYHLERVWSLELSGLKSVPKKERESLAEKHKDITPLKKPPTVKDLETHIKNIVELRQRHAKRYETLAIGLFTKHKDEIPAKDRRAYMTRIRAWHDKQELIKR